MCPGGMNDVIFTIIISCMRYLATLSPDKKTDSQERFRRQKIS